MDISVIIPVYNVEKYIRKCLESILKQTFLNIEILVINDGTKDNSIKIVKEYMDDKRIKVIEKENGGLSSARNVGIKEAKGKYIYFIDSDDWAEEDILEILYKDNKEEDIIFTNYIYYNDITGKERKKTYKFPDKLTTKEGKYFFYNDAEVLVWNRLYKREFLIKNELFFKEGIIHEDEEFSFKTLMLADKVKYVESYRFYYRTSREGSITYKPNYPKIITSLEKIEKSFFEFSFNNRLDKFTKMRLLLRKNIIGYRKKRYERVIVPKEEFREIENLFKQFLTENSLTKIERKVIIKDIQKLLLSKNLVFINFFDKFYWINGIYSFRVIKRLIKRQINYKLKNKIDWEG